MDDGKPVDDGENGPPNFFVITGCLQKFPGATPRNYTPKAKVEKLVNYFLKHAGGVPGGMYVTPHLETSHADHVPRRMQGRTAGGRRRYRDGWRAGGDDGVQQRACARCGTGGVPSTGRTAGGRRRRRATAGLRSLRD